MIPIDSNARPARGPGVRLQLDKSTGEPVLLYPEGVLELNDTAHAILNLCNGSMTVNEIVTSLAQEYEVPVEVLRADALECMGDLLQRRLLVLQ
jgi:pyrroloquinoline quinone biosynthesis protein D